MSSFPWNCTVGKVIAHCQDVGLVSCKNISEYIVSSFPPFPLFSPPSPPSLPFPSPFPPECWQYRCPGHFSQRGVDGELSSEHWGSDSVGICPETSASWWAGEHALLQFSWCLFKWLCECHACVCLTSTCLECSVANGEQRSALQDP